MRLEALELVEGREIRVRVAKPDDEADRDLIVFEMVEERAAIGVRIERPADGVDDAARPVFGRIDPPQLLKADPVGLRVAVAAKVEVLQQRLRQGSAAAFGDDGLARDKLDAGRIGCGLLAVPANPHVAGGDAAHRAFLIVEDLRCGEARKDFDASSSAWPASQRHRLPRLTM